MMSEEPLSDVFRSWSHSDGTRHGSQGRTDAMTESTVASNYAAEMLTQVSYEHPGLDPPLANLYALLALTKGTATTLEDVHDAWSIWVATTRGAHKSLISFAELAPEVQELDREYVDGIHRAARAVAT